MPKMNLDLVTSSTDKRGVTKEEIITRQDNVVHCSSSREECRSFGYSCSSPVEEAQVIVDFYTVRAPIDCEVMQINIHPGEFAAAIQSSNPATS